MGQQTQILFITRSGSSITTDWLQGVYVTTSDITRGWVTTVTGTA